MELGAGLGLPSIVAALRGSAAVVARTATQLAAQHAAPLLCVRSLRRAARHVRERQPDLHVEAGEAVVELTHTHIPLMLHVLRAVDGDGLTAMHHAARRGMAALVELGL